MLEHIRILKLRIDNLQKKIDNFTTLSAIRYDKECVQTSATGDSLEKAVIRNIENQQKLNQLKVRYENLKNKINLNHYTSRQQEFIELYYFQGLSINECSQFMNVKCPAISRIKCRINSAKP
ncbi:MAG: hypothetical protein Q4F03_04845 [Eubacteriales bacterium]|nr:hypothetical protein [Eubacteriales bacterium]